MRIDDAGKTLSDVCKEENIQIGLTSAKAVNDFTGKSTIGGFAGDFNGKKTIVLDEALKGWEKLLTLAHETAHYIFGHFDKCENGKLPDAFEEEARLFSVVFTAMAIFETTKGANDNGAGQED